MSSIRLVDIEEVSSPVFQMRLLYNSVSDAIDIAERLSIHPELGSICEKVQRLDRQVLDEIKATIIEATS